MRVQHGPETPFDRAGKNYLKSVYKIHLGPEEPCDDHCAVFTLSGPVEEKCCHDHNQAFPDCKGIVDILKAIELFFSLWLGK